MHLPFNEMRTSCLSSVEDIRYRKEQQEKIRKESAVTSLDFTTSGFLVVSRPHHCDERYECVLVDRNDDVNLQQMSAKVKELLEFSNCIVDPNRNKFSKAIRVVSLVIKTAKLLLLQWNSKRPLQQFSRVV